MSDVKAYLYDAEGTDREVAVDEVDVSELKDKQILWVIVLVRDEQVLRSVTNRLGVEDAPCSSIVDEHRRPELERHENFFRFSIDSVTTEKAESPNRQKIDFLVGENYILTVSNGEPEYFKEFRTREKGESMIGELEAESIVASLLDQNIVGYFRALNQLEGRIDSIDESVLKEDLDTETFLGEMVRLRSDASNLRRWLMPHREVYYALARPDFLQIAESTAAEHYRLLSQHFENAVDAVEHAREMVLGVFELYATKSTHKTNILIQRLTFLTLITGTVAVVAGILGMNFHADIFEIEGGFWYTVAGISIIGAAITVFARIRRWI